MFCENTMATIMDQKLSLTQKDTEEWKEQLEHVLKVCFLY